MTEEMKQDNEVSAGEAKQNEGLSVGSAKEQKPETPSVGAKEGVEVKVEQVKETPSESAQEAKEDENVQQKGPAKLPKTTSSVAPTECAACSKALLKKMWYYRNAQFFCNKKCFKRKEAENTKQTETV